jgi:hypothetical protein
MNRTEAPDEYILAHGQSRLPGCGCIQPQLAKTTEVRDLWTPPSALDQGMLNREARCKLPRHITERNGVPRLEGHPVSCNLPGYSVFSIVISEEALPGHSTSPAVGV